LISPWWTDARGADVQSDGYIRIRETSMESVGINVSESSRERARETRNALKQASTLNPREGRLVDEAQTAVLGTTKSCTHYVAIPESFNKNSIDLDSNQYGVYIPFCVFSLRIACLSIAENPTG
jgi:hypothetical protein